MSTQDIVGSSTVTPEEFLEELSKVSDLALSLSIQKAPQDPAQGALWAAVAQGLEEMVATLRIPLAGSQKPAEGEPA